MYCHDCNTANPVESKYCKECGSRINDGYRKMMLSVQDTPADPNEEALDRLTRLLDMAFWHNEAGNIEAAITASNAALAISPNSTTAHSLLGSLYEKRGDDVRAIQHFEAVLALNPESVADAAKLGQLRRGVHVKAAAPPMTHQLIPPALLKLGPVIQQKWVGLAEFGSGRTSLQRRPLYVGAAVTAGVLLGGLMLMRPWANAEAVPRRPASLAAVLPISAQPSAYVAGAASGSALDQSHRPMVLTPNPSPGGGYHPSPALTAYDPFAGRAPAVRRTASNPWSLPSVPRAAPAPRRHPAGGDLPPLRLAALPPVGSNGADALAPAPVSLPPGVGVPLARVASIPQHTVVVNSLADGGARSDGSQANLPSHIHITVHQVSDADANPVMLSPNGRQSDGDSGNADTYQQRAISLQQQGEYKQARLEYQRAIRAYEAQIASSQNVEAAQRGLTASQTGLEICQQSQ